VVSEEKILKYLPIRNKNCPWQPCLLMDWDDMSNLYRGPSIDASYQVSVLLAKGFQRRRLKFEKLTDDGRQVMAKTENQQKIENYIKEFGFIFDFLFFSHFTGKKTQLNLQHHQNNYGKIKLFAI
jgi:hypothetical protein